MLWKGRYRCAVTLSVDFDAETLWSGTFKLTTPSPLSRGDYDIRAGHAAHPRGCSRSTASRPPSWCRAR